MAGEASEAGEDGDRGGARGGAGYEAVGGVGGCGRGGDWVCGGLVGWVVDVRGCGEGGGVWVSCCGCRAIKEMCDVLMACRSHWMLRGL